MNRFYFFFVLLCSCADRNNSSAESSNASSDNGINKVDNVDVDTDGDGFTSNVDCDDNDATIFPGSVAEALNNECMKDKDGDGFGDQFATEPFDAGTDCDDSDANAYPGSAWLESNPNGCYRDADNDGYGSNNPSPNVTKGSDAWDDDPSKWFHEPATGHWTYGTATIISNTCSEDAADDRTSQSGFSLINHSDILFEEVLDDGISIMCNRSEQTFQCPIPYTTETITYDGIDIELGITTTIQGTFSSTTEQTSIFQINITCEDVDSWFVNCGDTSDVLPCSVEFSITATLDQ